MLDKFEPQGEDTNCSSPAWETSVSVDTVSAVISSLASNKAPGISGVTNGFLKMMGWPLAKAIAMLTEGCWQWEHYPGVFKMAWTVVLQKPGKVDYSAPKVW